MLPAFSNVDVSSHGSRNVPPRRFTEDGCPHKKFFHTRYLMRMRLTPDCSKMLISTSSGYLLILHDLDLTQSLEVGSYRMLRARRTPLTSGWRRQPSVP